MIRNENRQHSLKDFQNFDNVHSVPYMSTVTQIQTSPALAISVARVNIWSVFIDEIFRKCIVKFDSYLAVTLFV